MLFKIAGIFTLSAQQVPFYQNIAAGLVPYPAVMENNLQNELPFMVTENSLEVMSKLPRALVVV